MITISLKGVKRKIKKKEVINIDELTISQNKIIGLVGNNGAGKSTLLKVILGYLNINEGSIKINNLNVYNNINISLNSIFLDEFTMHIGRLNYIIETYNNSYENFDIHLANSLVTYFGLKSNRYFIGLSKGEKMIFNFILGISSRSQITIFDEITSGMDDTVRREVYKIILKDYIRHPRIIIISSHMLGEIENLLEEVIIIHKGSILLHEEIDHLNQYAIEIIGSRMQLEQILDDSEVLYKKKINTSQELVVVKNNLKSNQISYLRELNIKMKLLSANDLYVYLTDKFKGGLDEIYK